MNIDLSIQPFCVNIHLMYGSFFVKQKDTTTLWHNNIDTVFPYTTKQIKSTSKTKK